MEQLIEIRATGGTAYEIRNGSRVEYAATIDGQNKRMRALGCPEAVIQRAMSRKAARTGKPAPQRFLTVAEQDAERKRKALDFGTTIAADAAAEQQRQRAADSEQQRKDAELKRRMDAASGRTCK